MIRGPLVCKAYSVEVAPDGHVTLGLGDPGEYPTAVLILCPDHMSGDLVADLTAAQEKALPLHQHARNRAERRARNRR